MFDVFYEGENNPIKNLIPFAKKVDSFDLEEIKKKCRTKYFFFVEDNIKILDDSVFDTRPDTQRIFKWKKQGFNEYGGISLFPKNCEDALIEHVEHSATAPTIDVIESDPEEYFKNTNAAFVWVGNDLSIFDSGTNVSLDENNIYEVSQGDIVATLYPRNWKDLSIVKISLDDEEPSTSGYDVFRTNYMNDYSYAAKSKTDMFWLVDDDLEIQDLCFEPDDTSTIYVFKHPGQLEHRYPSGIKDPKDARAGGIKLVPKEFALDKIKFVEGTPASNKVYSINKIDNPSLDSVIANFTGEGWYVDSDYLVDDISGWIPEVYDRDKIHVFHLKGQLSRKYPEAMGGVYWVPRGLNRSTPFKISDFTLQYTAEKYLVHRTNDPSDITDTDQSAWYIDSEYVISGDIEIVPWQSPNEKNMIHVFHVEDQLDRKYTDKMGGAYWVPADWNGEYYIHKEPLPVKEISYPVHFVSDPSDFSGYSECWLIDSEYEMDPEIKVIPWRNTPERNMVHVFHIAGQLSHKYPEKMGGIYWYPENWNGEYFIHEEPIALTKTYPVVWSDDPANDIGKQYESDTWVIDRSYRFVGNLPWHPDYFDREKTHVFHIKGQLTNKYTESMGGVYWVPASGSKGLEVHKEVLTPTVPSYPVHYVEEPADFSNAKGPCWLVDEGYVLDKEEFEIVPWQNEKEQGMVHVYQVAGQLEHKYPEAMGGIYWIPENSTSEDLVIHEDYLFGRSLDFPVYDDEETGRAETTSEWFWVVDRDVTVVDDFSFDFVPSVWDRGKTHVWQKINPITGKQYDYCGVKLCPKVAETKGRPKYIRKPGCIQNNFPVFKLSPSDIRYGLKQAFEKFASETEASMMWILDPYAEVSEDFLYDYYPTQYDSDVVHIWQHDGDSRKTGVRLVPTSIEITDNNQIIDNSFSKLKEMQQVATSEPLWPVENLQEATVAEVRKLLDKHNDVSYIWTIDPDVEVDEKVIHQSIIPHEEFIDVVHVWKRTNNEGLVIGHGGLRLWPTNYPVENLTDEQVLTCSIPDQLILNASAGTQKEYPVYTILAEKDIEEQLQEFDTECDSPMYWVVDPFVTLEENWKFNYLPNKWEEHVVHVFADSLGGYRSVRLIPKGTFSNGVDIKQIVNNSFKHIKLVNMTASKPTKWPICKFNEEKPLLAQLKEFAKDQECFFTLDSDVDLIDDFVLQYTPQLDSVNKLHVWQKLSPHTNKAHAYGGLRLWPADINQVFDGVYSSLEVKLNRTKRNSLQYVRSPGSITKEFDIVYISYHEPYAEKNYNKLTQRFNNVIWVKDIEGIFNAHKEAAKACSTKMFWVVDADADVVEDFNFTHIPDVYDDDVVHVWSSKNPVTGLEYGYGGVKLFPRDAILKSSTWGLDFTTGLSKRFKAMAQVSCITRFNTDAYSAWRSAFRECVKLTLKDDAESTERLDAWLHPVPAADFKDDAKRGAEEGRAFAIANRDNNSELNKINDYNWLKERFNNE